MKLAAMIDTRMHDAEEVRILQNLSMLKMLQEHYPEIGKNLTSRRGDDSGEGMR